MLVVTAITALIRFNLGGVTVWLFYKVTGLSEKEKGCAQQNLYWSVPCTIVPMVSFASLFSSFTIGQIKVKKWVTILLHFGYNSQFIPCSLSWWSVPEKAVSWSDGKLQSTWETSPKRLCTHCGWTWPHFATNYWCGESLCVVKCPEYLKTVERLLLAINTEDEGFLRQVVQQHTACNKHSSRSQSHIEATAVSSVWEDDYFYWKQAWGLLPTLITGLQKGVGLLIRVLISY